jgi:hypothetical protein
MGIASLWGNRIQSKIVYTLFQTYVLTNTELILIK